MRTARAVISIVALVAVLGCTSTDETASDAFRVGGDATTTTADVELLPMRDEIVLDETEIAACDLFDRIDRVLDGAVEPISADLARMAAVHDNRRLPEPERVRTVRDLRLRITSRIADSFAGFDAAIPLFEAMATDEHFTDQEKAEQLADLEYIVAASETLRETVAAMAPEDPDIRTQEELDALLDRFDDGLSGSALAEDAYGRIQDVDDWSWRHCSLGFSD